MIRLLAYLAVFVIGLAGAAFWGGQMHHLRSAAPEQLPEWTEMLDDSVGLRRGRVELPAQGRWPAAELSWSARMPDAEGWLWDLELAGDGIDLKAELLLPYWPGKAVLRHGTGVLDIGAIAGMQVPVRGNVVLASLDLDILDPMTDPRASGTLVAEARQVWALATGLGDGPIHGRIDEDGRWRAEFNLAGGASGVAGEVSGVLAEMTGELDMTVADAAALPALLRRLAQRFSEPVGDGLRVRVPLKFAP